MAVRQAGRSLTVAVRPGEAVNMRRLTFYNKYLEAVRAGVKVTTIRKTRVVRNLGSGELILLAFGSYRNPTLIRAMCIEVTALDPARLGTAERRRMARRDGIDTFELDMILGDPEPKTLIDFITEDFAPLFKELQGAKSQARV